MSQIPTTLSGPEATPASGKTAKQLLVFLHGVGSNGDDLFGLKDIYSQAFPDAHIASPNAPFPCDMAPFGYQWFSLADRREEPMLAGAQTVEPILNHFIDSKLKALNLPIEKLGIIGFSQGTMTALHTLLRRPEPCGALVGFSGMMLAPNQLADEIQSKPPVCLIHGTHDDVVPYATQAAAQTALEQSGVPLETHSCQGLGHSIDEQGLIASLAFLQKYLGA